MTGIQRLPSTDCTVTITAAVTKLCPVKEEVDEGTVTIQYRTHGEALELHDVATYLEKFQGRLISHEDFTAEVASALKADVTSHWHTAGMSIECAS